MRILVDADALPGMIRDIVYRAAERKGLETVISANTPLRIPPGPLFTFILAPGGPDEADRVLAEAAGAGDLCVTNDIPLAARIAEKGGASINHRGELLDSRNVREKLAMRDFYDGLRSAEFQTRGPAPFSERDRRTFANALDTFLARNLK